MSKRAHIIRRFIQAVGTVCIVIVMNFLLFRVMPGDPVRILIRSPKIPPETLQKMREYFGLDQPLWVQFWYYVRDLFRGDLGISFQHRVPVMEVILERVPATLLLVGLGSILAIILGVLLGVFIAWRRGTKADVAGLSLSLILYSMPTFWFAILMVMLFAVYLRWFPTGGMRLAGAVFASNWDGFVSTMRHLFLPLLTFTVILIGQYALIMRNSLLEVLEEDYILTARAKGVTAGDLLRKHAVPNAMLPMVTLIAINLGFVIGGAIQAETVFSWPGLGRLMYAALMNRDYPLLQGLFLFTTTCVVGANFCSDILYGYLDPRIKS